jgi:N-methylhydantoinase A
VTDANLLLGFMDPGRFMGGKMALSRAAAEDAFQEHVAGPLGISVLEAAIGVFRIANNDLSNALRYVSVTRGQDPRDFALMAFGGAGAIHAGIQAVDLGIKTVLVPRNAPVLSAFGGLVADFKVSRVHSYIRAVESVDPAEMTELFLSVQSEAEDLLPSSDGTRLERYVDLRYQGQTREVIVPLNTRTKKITDISLQRAVQDFHVLHEKLYGHKRTDVPVQVVSIRVELTGLRRMGDVVAARKFESDDASSAQVDDREVYFERLGGMVKTPVYDGRLIVPGNVVAGPAVVHEPGTTIVIGDGQEAMLDQYETYVIEVVR